MAPTSRGRGRGSFRGRGRGMGDQIRSQRHKFRTTRAVEPDTTQDTESSDAEIDAISEVEDLRNQSSSSEDDELEPRGQSYDALLQMLGGPQTLPHPRKKRKTRHRGNNENQETSQELSKLPREILKDSPDADVDIDLDGTGGEVGEADLAEDDAQELKLGDDEINDMEGEEIDATDPFEAHFGSHDEQGIERQLKVVKANKWRTTILEPRAGLRKVSFLPDSEEPSTTASILTAVKDLKLKEKLVERATEIMPKMGALEQDVATHMFSYQDLVFCGRSPENAESLRNLTGLHVLNHVLKTRDRIVKNNARLIKDPDLEVRDQGFTRPKVLILLPTRQSCVRYIDTLMKFLHPEQQENKHRFTGSYSQPLDQWEDKPADFRELFSGNDDDMFRLGLKVTRKNVKYFSQFYNSDIILASPLGLRTAMEKSSDSKKEDHDYLSSIEICIVDQADALLMQNWQHTLHIFSHLNLLPKDAHNTDFSRVRPWYLDGHSQHFRQTLVFSAFLTAELNSLSSTYLVPLAGQFRLTVPSPGAILSIPLLPPSLTVKQTFSRFPSLNPQSDPQTRLTHFTTAILPSLLKSVTTPTLVFVPTHPLFLSLRNYLSTSQSTSSISFAGISEYTSVSDVSRARSNFVRERHSLLLYTERAHHFRRYKIKGVRRIIMVGLPENPLFYKELVGMLGLNPERSGGGIGFGNVRIFFSKWDALKLERVVGTERMAGMLKETGGDTFEFV